MIVCHCSVVSDRRILELIDAELAEGSAATDGSAPADDDTVLLGIGARCGAGLYCGGCVPAIKALLNYRRGIFPEAEGVASRSGVLEICVELRTRSSSPDTASAPRPVSSPDIIKACTAIPT